MDSLLLILLILICLAGVAPALSKPQRIYEFPVFMTLTFLIFIVPQGFALIRHPGTAPLDAVDAVLLMSVLCAATCLVGYKCRTNVRLVRMTSRNANERKLLRGGVFFLLVSSFFSFMIGRINPEEMGGSTWTGKVVIYVFFAGLIFPAAAILLRYALRRNTFPAWCLAGFAIIPVLQTVVMAGRREPAAHLLLTFGLMLYFERRIVPPRMAIVLVTIFAMLAIPATGKYRSLAAERDWNSVSKLDLLGNFDDFINRESTLELRNAAMIIKTTSMTGDYNYGVSYWDEIIWRYVPAQIVGRDLKNFLMIARDRPLWERNRGGVFRYHIPDGSTVTAMGDSFKSFGYFGCLFFLLPAYLFKSLWYSSTAQSGVYAQLLYVGSVTSAMRAITHQSTDFIPGILFHFVFIGLLWSYSSQRLMLTQQSLTGMPDFRKRDKPTISSRDRRLQAGIE